MNITEVIAALHLPKDGRGVSRVPKKTLLEYAGFSAGDRRAIQKRVEELFWVAALKPGVIVVSAYRDAEREYLEIAVLWLTLRTEARAARIMELIHRAVPYPVLLVTEYGKTGILSAAEIRGSQSGGTRESGKTVLDGEMVTASWETDDGSSMLADFKAALALERQPNQDMRALYRGWMDTLDAWRAARRTGVFILTPEAERRAARREAPGWNARWRACA